MCFCTDEYIGSASTESMEFVAGSYSVNCNEDAQRYLSGIWTRHSIFGKGFSYRDRLFTLNVQTPRHVPRFLKNLIAIQLQVSQLPAYVSVPMNTFVPLVSRAWSSLKASNRSNCDEDNRETQQGFEQDIQFRPVSFRPAMLILECLYRIQRMVSSNV